MFAADYIVIMSIQFRDSVAWVIHLLVLLEIQAREHENSVEITFASTSQLETNNFANLNAVSHEHGMPRYLIPKRSGVHRVACT